MKYSHIFGKVFQFIFASLFVLITLSNKTFGSDIVVKIDPSKFIGKFEYNLLGQNIEWIHRCDGILSDTGQPGAKVLDKIKNLKIPVLRYPGGSLASTYDWKGGIGEPAKRAMGTNDEKLNEPMIFGTQEYLELLHTLKANGMITLNPMLSPDSSLEWIDYIKQHGGGVKYIEFGNESYLKDDPSFMSSKKYVESFQAIAKQIKNEYPDIQVGAILEGSIYRSKWANHMVPEVDTWNNYIISQTSDMADFYILHLYAPMQFIDSELDTLKTSIAGTQIFEKNIQNISILLKQNHSTAKLWITEYNILTDNAVMNWRCGTSMAQSVYLADLLMAMVRTHIAGATYWSLIGNNNFGMIKDSKECDVRGSYLLFVMLSHIVGANALDTDVDAPQLKYKEGGVIPPGIDVKQVGAQGFELDGNFYVLLTNRDLQFTQRVRLDFVNKSGLSSVSSQSLIGPSDFSPGIEQSGRIRLIDRPSESDFLLMPGSVMLVHIKN